MAYNIVLQDIYTIKHIYNFNKIIRMWHADSKKGLYIKVIIILTEKPILETILIYTSLYSLSVKSLQRVLLISILLLNVLEAKTTSSIPKKKGNISTTITQQLALSENILVKVFSGNLAPLIAFQ